MDLIVRLVRLRFDEPQSKQERLQTRRDLLLAAPTFPF